MQPTKPDTEITKMLEQLERNLKITTVKRSSGKWKFTNMNK